MIVNFNYLNDYNCLYLLASFLIYINYLRKCFRAFSASLKAYSSLLTVLLFSAKDSSKNVIRLLTLDNLHTPNSENSSIISVKNQIAMILYLFRVYGKCMWSNKKGFLIIGNSSFILLELLVGWNFKLICKFGYKCYYE
jgi:hypothetical protein